MQGGNYSIKYDSTDCILSENCLISSVLMSLQILFVISLLYWIAVMIIVFLLLRFNIDVIAGYALASFSFTAYYNSYSR